MVLGGEFANGREELFVAAIRGGTGVGSRHDFEDRDGGRCRRIALSDLRRCDDQSVVGRIVDRGGMMSRTRTERNDVAGLAATLDSSASWARRAVASAAISAPGQLTWATGRNAPVAARSQAAPPTAESADTLDERAVVKLFGVDRRAGQLAEAGEHVFELLPGVGAACRTRGGERSGHNFQYIQLGGFRCRLARRRGGGESRGTRRGCGLGRFCGPRAVANRCGPVTRPPANMLACRWCYRGGRRNCSRHGQRLRVIFPPSSAKSVRTCSAARRRIQRILSDDA